MEAEYIACFYAIQGVTWIRALLSSIGLKSTIPTSVCIDNKSAKDLALNPVHQRSKNIDVKFHWIRDKINDKTIVLDQVDTTDQRADVLTKAVDGSTFHRHVDHMMVEIIEWLGVLTVKIRSAILVRMKRSSHIAN